MGILLTIIAFIVIFSFLILIHELGHFVAAKRAGIRVDEFGFGLPPRIWGKKIGETIYSVNLFPFGGFVRLYGEDSTVAGALGSKRSFVGKSLRQRFWVVFAGVFMNFILAVFLLTIGFSFGIEPLLINEKDVLGAIDEGQIEIQSGIRIAEVASGSVAEKLGIQKGDTLVEMNGNSIFDFNSLQQNLEKPPKDGVDLKLRRDPSFINITVPFRENEKLGLEFHDMFFLPRVVIGKITEDSSLSASGLQEGDVILKMNGSQIYSIDDYYRVFQSGKKIEFFILRNFKEMKFDALFPNRRTVLLGEVLTGSPAEKAGLMKGDQIVQVNNLEMKQPQDISTLLLQGKGQQVQFLVDRNGKLLTFYVSPDQGGKIGVVLSPLLNQDVRMNVYLAPLPTSVLKIHDVKLNPFSAFFQSLKETYKLGTVTISMLGGLIQKVATSFEVPDGVAGPIGIAQMTSVFVEQGLLSLIRFAALLSLSLAVMNLLPFPGLDGGRLFFIIIEGIRGRKLKPSVEQMIHAVGFIILIGLILAVTYKDILRLFT